jgi:diphthine-ammonia ligase
MKLGAALWTGGKDCSLALYEARRSGVQVGELVTLAPPLPVFLAHPIPFLTRQAAAMGVRHRTVEIRPPLEAGYTQAMRMLRAEGIEVLVTGDIAEVDGHPNWIRQTSRGAGLEVLTPLWGRDRRTLLSDFLGCGFKAVFSLVKKPWFTRQWVGRAIDGRAVKELGDIARDTGLDLCGENGEYHSLILDGPTFKRGLRIAAFDTCERDEMMYMDGFEIADEEKPLGPMQMLKQCLRCGGAFVCGADQATGHCWCAELLPVMPVTDEGCFCSNCLRQEVASLQSQQATGTIRFRVDGSG